MPMMTEREQALILANAVLDDPYYDPDGDMSVLARQLLRRTEELEAYKAAYLELVTPNPNQLLEKGEKLFKPVRSA